MQDFSHMFAHFSLTFSCTSLHLAYKVLSQPKDNPRAIFHKVQGGVRTRSTPGVYVYNRKVGPLDMVPTNREPSTQQRPAIGNESRRRQGRSVFVLTIKTRHELAMRLEGVSVVGNFFRLQRKLLSNHLFSFQQLCTEIASTSVYKTSTLCLR